MNETVHAFTALGLEKALVRAVDDLGFISPTPVQQKTIPHLIQNQGDLIALAQTGTGKTAAFGLPMLQALKPDLPYTQALILAPTRELCLQITRDLVNFSKYLPQYKTVAVYGGASIDQQLRQLKQGATIVVATPGRLIDMLDRRGVNLQHINVCILDEADEMLNMGFKEDIDRILAQANKERLTWLFSATMPDDVRRISRLYMHDPEEIKVGETNATNANIEHQYYVVLARQRYAAIKRIIDFNPDLFGLVFTRTKADAQDVAEQLMRDGYNADALHGDLSQPQRDKVMGRFRDRSIQLLIATDVAARGIDVSDITHVINYDLPDDLEVYTHRSGRTARAGKKGISISIVGPRDIQKISALQRFCKTTFRRMMVPNGQEVCERQLYKMVEDMKTVEVHTEEMEAYMPKILGQLEDLSKEEIVTRFAALEFNRFIKYYAKAQDLNYTGHEKAGGEKGDRGDRNDRGGRKGGKGDRDGGGFKGREKDPNTLEITVSLGERDGVSKTDIIELFNTHGLRQIRPKRIKLMRACTYIDIAKDEWPIVESGLKGAVHNGRRVKTQKSTENA